MKKRGNRKEIKGVVVSDKMDKTISVRVERLVKHEKYKKYIRKWTNYKAHDENNQAKIGDIVLIKEVRPLSKTKRWRLLEILVKKEGT